MKYLLLLLAACSGGTNDGPGVGNGPDAPPADASLEPVTLPTWMLEDIQPLSPRTGQTYGLDGFANQTIVVTLVQGF